MGWVDKVPRCSPPLYIGGLHALYQRRDLFDDYHITHIISVLDFDIYEAGHFSEFKHIHVKIDDDPNEDLLQYFDQSNAFIAGAAKSSSAPGSSPSENAVFVHCAMGKSRSATIVCAYLMWKYELNPRQALNQLCEGRPICGPNPGFMEQLGVYYEMLKAKDEEGSRKIYDKWKSGRFRGEPWEWQKRSLGKL